jgi:hypothetical protein
MDAVLAAGMIVDVPIGEVERGLEPIRDAVLELMPKIEFVCVRLAISTVVKLPRDPILQFQFTFVRGSDLVSEGEERFRRAKRMG